MVTVRARHAIIHRACSSKTSDDEHVRRFFVSGKFLDKSVKEGVLPHQNLKDPLHGVTLEVILSRLVEHVGWKELAHRIPVRCFLFDPTITSSLRFFRKTPWARKKVEDLYVRVFKKRFCTTKGKQ